MSLSRSPVNEYLFGKGEVSLYERGDDGSISGKALYIGNCSELKISGTADKITHTESESGRNVQDRSIITKVSLDASVTFESILGPTLAVVLWGTEEDIDVAATQTYEFANPVAVGDVRVVPEGFNLTSVSLKDAATPTPATVDVADYDVDPVFGTVKFLDLGAYTQPFTLHYDRGAAKAYPMFTGSQPFRFLRFEGLNLGNPGQNVSQKVLVEIFNIGFDPPTDMSFIGDNFASFQLKGNVQIDETRKDNSALGGYMRIVKL